jgi:CheY-like chemotaxis protein
MEGIEATHKIFRCADRNRINNIAIVALTAYVTSVEKQKCLDMGMKQVLSKPIQSQSLNMLLQK